ncbi:MAG: glycosyltransferase family protein [Anaerolineales bacterium]|nr:glycosyltransferase family protein [Anaerolineales bacterium]
MPAKPLPPTPIAIVQARMSSSRLPGKVLLDIAGQPMLSHVVERTRRAQLVQQTIVATTTDPSDDPIEDLCEAREYPYYRGSLHDVLERYYKAARQFGAQTIVRITADCPLIDPGVIDETLLAFANMPECDFAANRLPPPWRRSYPIGLDTEVCSFSALERAWKQAGQKFHREHVMPYLYEGVQFASQGKVEPGTSYITRGRSARGFQIAQLHHKPDYGTLRWTVDTAADLELVRQIYARFPGRTDFTWQDVLVIFENEPELASINAEIRHKTVFEVDGRS